MTHICVGILIIIGSDNGLSPGRRQAIIWTNAGILLIGPLGTNFIEILIGIQTFSFKKMYLKVSSAKRRPFCLVLNVLDSFLWTEYISKYHLQNISHFIQDSISYHIKLLSFSWQNQQHSGSKLNGWFISQRSENYVALRQWSQFIKVMNCQHIRGQAIN